MVNKRRSGQSTELKGIKILQEQGWYLEARAPPSKPFNKQVDLCEGLFDAILHKTRVGIKKRLYVQFKTRDKPKLEPFEEFCKTQCDDRDIIEVWVWRKRKGFKVWRLLYDLESVKIEVLNGLPKKK